MHRRCYWRRTKYGEKIIMQIDLTKGPITKNLIKFTLPLILGNIFQQLYNIADTWVVGKFIGSQALGAVGASYTLMVFLTSIFIGLCMGSGGVFALYKGGNQPQKLTESIQISFVFIFLITIVINIVSFASLNYIVEIFNVPVELKEMTVDYLKIIFCGMTGVFLYNYFANLLRSVGNSVVPLIVLAFSAILNIVMDLSFVIKLGLGVKGAALATVFAQYISGIFIAGFVYVKEPSLRLNLMKIHYSKEVFAKIKSMSLLTCVQQSVMNFGILLVQGLINSFGTVVMAAFTAAVKIDTIAYSPLQDFGNGFSTFIGQNYGANESKRIKAGIKSSFKMVAIFSLTISAIVCIFAKEMMSIFVDSSEQEIISTGVSYLRIEGAFYIGIGILFMLYGFYRAILVPQMSLVLTIISLGTRVVLAYLLSSFQSIGVIGIWVSVPIGWILADITGCGYYIYMKKRKKHEENWIDNSRRN